MNFLARPILDVKLAVDNDLHLVVRIVVHQRRSLLQSVEARDDGGYGVVWLGSCEVSQEGILVGDEREFEIGLSLWKVLEGCWLGWLGGLISGSLMGLGSAEERTHDN